MKYKEWADTWLNNIVRLTTKERTFNKYSRIVNRHILPYFQGFDLEGITAIELQNFCGEKIASGLSSNTVNGLISVLRSTLKSAYTVGLLSSDCSSALYRAKTREKRVLGFDRKEQFMIEQYVVESGDSRLFGIVLALYTGVRVGELLSLKWDDVNFEKGVIAINKSCHDSWQDNHYVKVIDTTKTGNSERIIPIAKGLIRRLKEIKLKSEGEFVVPGKSEYGSEVRTYQRTFEVVLQKLGLPHRGFHSLRHTFATRALEAGMDVKNLADILGHSNPTVTLKRYAQSMLEYKAEMMDKIGRTMIE